MIDFFSLLPLPSLVYTFPICETVERERERRTKKKKNFASTFIAQLAGFMTIAQALLDKFHAVFLYLYFISNVPCFTFLAIS
jgi:hypothetical protein